MATICERHVQAIWYDAALRPERLVTRRGSEVRVISPGEWNLEAGPDFRRAVLELGPERRRVTGDVEIHLAPSDWDLHGHGADPNYRNVIAHVTWGCGPEPVSLPPGAVSIWIGRFMTADTSFLPEQIDLAAYPYACRLSQANPCEMTVGRDPDRARAILAAAGRRRLRLKADRLLGRLCAAQAAGGGTRRQTFYEEVMTALGYKRNEVPFRRVAERVPIGALPTELGVAQRALLAAGAFEEWDRSGCRPWNAPERRLANAAGVMVGTRTLELADTSDFSRSGCRDMVMAMSRDGYMGKGRAAAILANVIAPFALAEGRIGEVPDWLPPEDISSPVRLTAFRLFGRDHNPSAHYANNGLLIQGLLQIHREFCLRLHPDCGRCEIGDAFTRPQKGSS